MTTVGTPLARAFVRLEINAHDAESQVKSAVQKAGQSGAKEAEHQGRSISQSFKHGMEFAAGFTGVELGIQTLHKVVSTGIDELKNYQAGYSQLQAGLASTGGVAGITADQMEKLASKIQGYSGQTDDSIVKTESLLLTFTAIRNEAGKGNDVFTQTTKIAADMAARMGGDASQAAIQLGKALNDPIQGMSALQRVGVSFTLEQKAQITAMEKAGNTMGAQKLILAELNKEFGGSAAAYGKTLPGQVDIAKRHLEDFAQSVTADALPAVAALGHGAADLVNYTAKTVEFFSHNEAAAAALAGVLGASMIPKLSELAITAQTFVAVKLESAFAAGAGGIRAMGAALLANPELYGLAAALAAAGVAVELFAHKEHDAKIDVQSLTDAVKQQDTVGGTSLSDEILKQFTDVDLGNKGENVLEYLQRYKVNISDLIEAINRGNLYGSGGVFDQLRSIENDPSVSGGTDSKLQKFFIGLSNDIDSTRKGEAALSQNDAEMKAQLDKTPQGRFVEFLGEVQKAQAALTKSTADNNQTIGGQIDLLKQYSAQADVTASNIQQHILDNIKTLAGEGANLQTLSANGVDPDFIKKLVAEGPEYVAAVASSSKALQVQLGQQFKAGLTQQMHTASAAARAEAPAAAAAVATAANFALQAQSDAMKTKFFTAVSSAVAQARTIASDGGRDTANAFGAKGEASRNKVLQSFLKTLPDPVRQAALSALGIATDAGGKIPTNLASAINAHAPKASQAAENLRLAVQTKIDLLHGKTIDVSTQDNASAALNTINGDLKQLEGLNNTLKATRITAADGGRISGPGGPRDDVIPAWLSNGEHVTNAASTTANDTILRWMDSNPGQRMPGFAAGGTVDFSQDVLSTHPFVQSFADYLGGSGFSALLSGSSGGGSIGGAARWLPVVLQALALNGASTSWAPAVLRQIQFESGGDPNIHQQVIDINTFNGSGGAQGLMQVLYSTFMSNHVPGTSLNIFDPLANVAAGIHHAIFEDPGGLAYLGQGHGYDTGGPWPSGTVGWNTSGRTEHVLTGGQMDGMLSLLSEQNRLLRTQNKILVSQPAATASILNGVSRHARLDERTRTMR